MGLQMWVEKTQTASYNGLISVFTISLLQILIIQTQSTILKIIGTKIS